MTAHKTGKEKEKNKREEAEKQKNKKKPFVIFFFKGPVGESSRFCSPIKSHQSSRGKMQTVFFSFSFVEKKKNDKNSFSTLARFSRWRDHFVFLVSFFFST